VKFGKTSYGAIRADCDVADVCAVPSAVALVKCAFVCTTYLSLSSLAIQALTVFLWATVEGVADQLLVRESPPTITGTAVGPSLSLSMSVSLSLSLEPQGAIRLQRNEYVKYYYTSRILVSESKNVKLRLSIHKFAQ